MFALSVLLALLFPLSAHAQSNDATTTISLSAPTITIATSSAPAAAASVARVPYYSQFSDIASSSWRGRGCGIASLAMIISYFNGATTSVNALLNEGVKAGAYSPAGWTYAGLIKVAKAHGLSGAAVDSAKDGKQAALSELEAALKRGPVIASVHYKFEPKNPIPHLVVIAGIKDGVVYYNDPAKPGAGNTISLSKFSAAWKMRYIALAPAPALALR